MASHLNIPQLGRLETVEVYEYYDRPLLFASRNASGAIYLAVLTEEVENSESWLVVSLSQRRFENLRSGSIDLHDAFVMAEDGIVYDVHVASDTQVVSHFGVLESKTLAEDSVPVAGERLKLDTQTLPALIETLGEKAYRSRREYINLGFSIPDMLRSEAPAKFLGQAITNFQAVVEAAFKRIRVLTDSTRSSLGDLFVTGFAPGSFVVEMASADTADLFDETEVGTAIEAIMKLVEIGNDVDLLKTQLERLEIDVAASYLKFLKSVTMKGADTSIDWASPKPDKHLRVRMPVTVARQVIEVIGRTEFSTPEEITFNGILVGANLRAKTYEISASETDKPRKYSGKVRDEAMATVIGAVLNREYAVTVVRTSSLSPVTGEVETKHALLRLRAL